MVRHNRLIFLLKMYNKIKTHIMLHPIFHNNKHHCKTKSNKIKIHQDRISFNKVNIKENKFKRVMKISKVIWNLND